MHVAGDGPVQGLVITGEGEHFKGEDDEIGGSVVERGVTERGRTMRLAVVQLAIDPEAWSLATTADGNGLVVHHEEELVTTLTPLVDYGLWRECEQERLSSAVEVLAF